MEERFRITGFDGRQNMKWLLKAVKGEVLCREQQGFPKGITTDSRLVKPGDLFIPLHGENQDGAQFIADAVKKGAAAVLISKTTDMPKNSGAMFIRVADTLTALGDLAAAWRHCFNLPVIGITGAAGKTTTKQLIGNILARGANPHTSWKNWNNLIGLPLTVLGLRSLHTHLLLEMGMNHPGEIARLTEIANPSVRLITNVLPVHLAGVKNIEGVAKAKAELVQEITKEQTFVVNLDDNYVSNMASQLDCHQVTFSLHRDKADVRLITSSQKGFQATSGTLSVNGKQQPFEFPMIGEHNLNNMLAAVATCQCLGVDTETILNGITTPLDDELRSNAIELNNDTVIYNDCYNANPGSMKAALNLIQASPANRHIAVLGDMFELGEQATPFHQHVITSAIALGFNNIYCLGKTFCAAAAHFSEKQVKGFFDRHELIAELINNLTAGDLVLIKGSRLMAMENITTALIERFGRRSS